ncbi:MAG: hypothetical protein HQL40_01665, partial [Alphaproteobacteria bacterium]|nr:hypothetical protein [Alphaproteobacteria bacterium]
MNLGGVLRSLGWAVGLVGFAGGAVWPLYEAKVQLPAQKAVIEQSVKVVVEAEKSAYLDRERFATFGFAQSATKQSGLDLSALDARVVVSATGTEGGLVVRGMPSTEAEAYDRVPTKFRRPFEETIGQINQLLLDG